PIDIETIPTQSPERMEVMADRIFSSAEIAEPPATYKKPEAIQAWKDRHLEETRGRAADAHHATALEGSWGEVCCICWWSEKRGEMVTHQRGTEASVLQDFSDDMRAELAGLAPTFLGYSVQFDLRFLHHRFVIQGIKPGFHLSHNAPPWRSGYIDLRHEWYGAQPGKGTKLVDLCEVFGIEVDDTIDGSQVAERWDAGDIGTIVSHCRADVVRVRELYARIFEYGGAE
ncbi:unnamed protein product, partial [marine sediment metagenome]